MTTTATETSARAFSEDEVNAIVADRVTRETAALTEQAAQATGRVTELENQLDIRAGEVTTLTSERDTARQELADYRTQIEGEREAASRKDSRVSELKEAAAHLGDAFYEDEARVTRICAMDDDSWASYKADLAATSGTTPPPPSRETAMQGEPVVPAKTKGDGGSVAPAAQALIGRSLPQEA